MYKSLLLFFTLALSIKVEANNYQDCGISKKAQQLAKLIINDDEQLRPSIRCNKLLSEIALVKAKKMLEFGLVTHNLDGSPNALLREHNYKLPDYYGTDFNSNQVEAVAGGYSSAEEVWSSFKDSEAHRVHLLGEHKFYAEQDELGVALIEEWSSPHVEYWVVYLTKGYAKNQVYRNDQSEIPNKANFILQKNNSINSVEQ
ncbi:CAP domain-containing protein [Litorilituus lipolyticus]|uniref:CAP domain-containing protein n=1 Tax=Litorilituus lipolyticus TaxID=2491017 RepID=A0A502KX34_9GAMM|nr:CAP domain-containing protein [Litorilituus lipolyticus]TPH12797.1 CAP domain-containing protein [Litorilituus lipolyticus]